MIALDTNVVVRLISDDNDAQTHIALELLAKSDVWMSLSVVMEAEWVLRSVYGYSPARIGSAFTELLRMQGVEAEYPECIIWAVDRMLHGADFADMIHLFAARDMTSFATFDQKLARQAGDAAPVPVQTLDA